MERDTETQGGKPYDVIRREILEKIMEQLKELSAAKAATKPDVIVKTTDNTVLFESQNRQASQWLRQRCQMSGETVTGNTAFKVHPSLCREIAEEMKTAGFAVKESIR